MCCHRCHSVRSEDPKVGFERLRPQKEHFAQCEMYVANVQELQMVWPGYYGEVGPKSLFSADEHLTLVFHHASSCTWWNLAKAPDFVKWQTLQSEFIIPPRKSDWIGTKAEDDLISRCHTERMEGLHVWCGCEVKCVEEDNYGFNDYLQSSTCFILGLGRWKSVWWCFCNAHLERTCQ